MATGIGQRQSAAKPTPKNQPLLDRQKFPQLHQVIDQMGKRIVGQTSLGCRSTSATLIHQNNAISSWVKKSPTVEFATGARPSVQKHHRNSVRVTAFVNIKLMHLSNRHPMPSVGFDFWVKGLHGLGFAQAARSFALIFGQQFFSDTNVVRGNFN